MESQPAILETATGSSGQSSSESIVSATRSGASSISTTFSKLDEPENNLILQIRQLQEEKKLLEGRIRGYLTLSDLLVEARKENQKLQAEMKELKANQGEKNTNHGQSLLSFSSLTDASGKECSQQDRSKPTLDKKLESLLTTPSVNGHGPVLTSSLPTDLTQGSLITFGSEDPDETQVVQLPKNKMLEMSVSAESTPTQESLEACSTEGQGGSGSDDMSHSSSGKGEDGKKSAVNRTWNAQDNGLQLDSDKYSEATYEKIGAQLGSASGRYISSAFTTSGTVRSGDAMATESHPIDFPSLCSVNSNGGTRRERSQQSFIGQASDAGPQGLLTHQTESLAEMFSNDQSDVSPSFAAQMHQLTESVAKIHQREVEQKKLMAMVMQENRTLKKMVRDRERDHAADLARLREENIRLRQNKPGLDEMAALKTSCAGEWVQVERPVTGGEPTTGTEVEMKLADRVRKLELANAELQLANANWNTQWEQMDRNNKMKIHELTSEITALQSRLNEQTASYENHMTAKEDAQHQLRLAERKIQELEDHQAAARSQLSDMSREKQAITAELNVLKAQMSGQGMHGVGATSMSRSALETEIAALKQQLTVFAEDFEQERQDRALAQAARDTAKKTCETLARQVQQLDSQVKHLQRQVKDREDTITSTLHQNEALQQHNTELKKKLAAEWDARQSLHRALKVAQRQQQQQQLRNPYLVSDPPTGTTYQTGYLSRPPYYPASHPDRYGFAYPDIYSSADHALLMSRGLDQPGGHRGEEVIWWQTAHRRALYDYRWVLSQSILTSPLDSRSNYYWSWSKEGTKYGKHQAAATSRLMPKAVPHVLL
ncbi:hypothetical protein C0Q70_02234 [Pomacea canaliculata]|uniref:Uncharacterized protein n=1 Tax=Pomacea canaliculata TaxID=400727 RepID=A0A2T7Q1Q1_POMCA|nr:hypothetical protein C0Q70_02234 [Pomacea canaliculata]